MTKREEQCNQWGEELETVGGLTLNNEYRDCECDDNHIHHYTVDRCVKCGANYAEWPNSHENEVEAARNGGPFPFRQVLPIGQRTE